MTDLIDPVPGLPADLRRIETFDTEGRSLALSRCQGLELGKLQAPG
jgi:hypothetical protein